MVFVKYLLKKKFYRAGRNSTGRIACRHKGGSSLKTFENVNYRRRIYDTLGKVIKISRNSIRSGLVALVVYKEFGLYEYILCPHLVKINAFILAVNKIGLSPYGIFSPFINNIGNSFLIKHLATGANIFNVEKCPGKGGVIARAAGMLVKIVQKISLAFGRVYVAIRFKTGKIIYLKGECSGVLGQCSNVRHRKTNRKKAGLSRHLGKRPSVRGVAMNPVDHPHGGGEGKTSGGRPSVSLWGFLTKGKKTRSLNKKRKIKVFLNKLKFGSSFK